MYEKIEWFIQHGDGGVLFINGHNGHIEKTSIAGYTCLGELVSNHLGSGYYAIGTDAQWKDWMPVLRKRNLQQIYNSFREKYTVKRRNLLSSPIWRSTQNPDEYCI